MALRIDCDLDGGVLYVAFDGEPGVPLRSEFPAEDVVVDRGEDDRLVGVELLGRRAKHAGCAIREILEALLGEELACEVHPRVAAAPLN